MATEIHVEDIANHGDIEAVCLGYVQDTDYADEDQTAETEPTLQ